MRVKGLASRTKSGASVQRPRKRQKYRPFPYAAVARMWARGLTIAHIARVIKRVDKNNPNGDLYHSLRNFLYRMHTRGYMSAEGQLVRLPYRVSTTTVRAARKAGLRAW